jgi:hypothetical protein
VKAFIGSSPILSAIMFTILDWLFFIIIKILLNKEYFYTFMAIYVAFLIGVFYKLIDFIFGEEKND